MGRDAVQLNGVVNVGINQQQVQHFTALPCNSPTAQTALAPKPGPAQPGQPSLFRAALLVVITEYCHVLQDILYSVCVPKYVLCFRSSTPNVSVGDAT